MTHAYRCIVAGLSARPDDLDAIVSTLQARPDLDCRALPPERARHASADLLVLCAGQAAGLMPLVAECRGFDARRALLVVADFDSEQSLAALIALGMTDFVRLPLSRPELSARVDRLLGAARLSPEPTGPVAPWLGCEDPLLFSVNPRFNALLARLPRLAASSGNVSIIGERGTGRRPYLQSLCALLGPAPRLMLDGERALPQDDAALPTIIDDDGRGLILAVHAIDALPLPQQSALLSLAAQRERSGPVRWLVTLLASPAEQVAAGRLLPALADRLQGMTVRTLPLRERREDLLPLAQIFLRRECEKRSRRVPAITPAAARLLMAHQWTGNVRELRATLERTLDTAAAPVLAARDLMLDVPVTVQEASLQEVKAQLVVSFERGFLENLLSACQGNIAQAARLAKKNRRALFELIRKHGIDVDQYRSNVPRNKAEEAVADYAVAN